MGSVLVSAPLRARTVAVAGGAVAVAWAAAALLACSGNGTTGTGSESDAATDQTTVDGTGGGDAEQPESSAADVAVDADGGASSDSAAEADVGPTCTPVDAAVDAASVAAGQILVASHQCMDCHGNPSLSGGAVVSGAYSKNLTPDPATGLGCWTDQQIVTAILYGMTPDGIKLCVMPQWGTTGFDGETLNAAQAEDIVQYLRTVPIVENYVPPSPCETPWVDAGPEAGPDAAPEAGADAAREAGPDAAFDATPDSAAEAGHEGGADARSGDASDATTD